jgi:CRP-like cAMP-binding protein
MTVEPGDVVGWSALVPPYRATSTAVAVEPTRLLAFDGASLRKALQEDPALAATVYPRVLEAVARRLGATRHQLLDLYGRDQEPVMW